MPDSAVARLEAVLLRLAEIEPLICSYVDVDREGALARARQLDDTGSAGPLVGRPFGVKEVISVAGLPAAGGSPAFADHVADQDATVVARLREAGAVLVGTHVSHELTCGLDEPPTRNPWALDSYPGGSSAGGGASVAAGLSSFAIGTDAAGSVRIPAAMTGVVGLKPTAGLVSAHGVVRHATAPSIDNVGILARSAAEVFEVLQVISGPDPADAATLWTLRDLASAASLVASGRLDGRRLGILGDGTRSALAARTPLESDVWRGFEAACEDFRHLGATLVPVEFPGIEAAPEAVFTFFAAELAAAHRHVLEGHTAGYHPRVRELLIEALSILPSQVAEAVAFRRGLKVAVEASFTSAGIEVLLTPTTPRVAMPLDSFDPATELVTLVPYTCPFNLTGQPAVSVPCGFAAAGVPIGLQLVGMPFEEASLLEVAASYQEATSWHKYAPEVSQ